MSASFIARVCGALSERGVRHAVVGGYAVALHGAIRGTVDVDLVLEWNLPSLLEAERAFHGMGLVSRLPIEADELFHFREEYVQRRNLVAWNFYNPANPAEQVDLVVTYDLKGKRRRLVQTVDGPIPILGRRELIEMKRASGRAQDLEDADALERL